MTSTPSLTPNSRDTKAVVPENEGMRVFDECYSPEIIEEYCRRRREEIQEMIRMMATDASV